MVQKTIKQPQRDTRRYTQQLREIKSNHREETREKQSDQIMTHMTQELHNYQIEMKTTTTPHTVS